MKGDFSRFTHDPRRAYHSVFQQQGRVHLDADWNEGAEIDAYLDRAALVDVVGRCHVSRTTPRAFEIAPAKSSFTIGVGRMWTDGLLAECFGTGSLVVDPVLDTPRGTDPVAYERQPFLPDPPPLPHAPYLIYLDVWQRAVTSAEDPALADVALGGVDTSVRIQTVWQVHAAVGDEFPRWEPSTGSLTVVPGTGGYRGFDNQLYRVEIHEAGHAGDATFKWSRDNGATAAPVASIQERSIRPGRALPDLGHGDLIEILDDRDELWARPGVLSRVKEASGEHVAVETPIDPVWPDQAVRPRLRRWDGQGKATHAELEHGIEVSFGKGSYRTGDWWVIPVRTADGSIEWPDAAPPRGINHHYCPLALVTAAGDVEDRRR